MNFPNEVQKILDELSQNRDMLDGTQAMLKATELSALQGNLTTEIATLENECAKELDGLLEKNEKMSVSRAKIKLEATENYKKLNRRKRINNVLTEEIRNLRTFSRIRKDEMMNSFEPRI